MGSSNPTQSRSSTPATQYFSLPLRMYLQLPPGDARDGGSSFSASSGTSSPSYSRPSTTISSGPCTPTSSTSSHFSCSNLPDDNENRWVSAQHVGNTVEHARGTRVPPMRACKKGSKTSGVYPHEYRNREGLDTKVLPPIMEFPIRGQGGPYFTNNGERAGCAARAIYNPTNSQFPANVIYHDPTKATNHGNNMSVAPYRPRTTKDT